MVSLAVYLHRKGGKVLLARNGTREAGSMPRARIAAERTNGGKLLVLRKSGRKGGKLLALRGRRCQEECCN